MRKWPLPQKLGVAAYLLLCALLFILLLAGCATQKGAEKFYKKHPEALALKCSETFPLKDTVTVVQEIARVDTLVAEPTYIFDTLYVEGVTKIVKRPCPPGKVTVQTVNTDRFHYVRDRAYERVQRDSIEALQSDNSKLMGEKLQLEKGVRDKSKWLWWFIGLLALVVGGGVWKVIKVLKPTINIKK